MSRHTLPLALLGIFAAVPAAAQVSHRKSIPDKSSAAAGGSATPPPRRQMGGGFVDLFNGTGEPPRQQRQSPQYRADHIDLPGSTPIRAALAPRGSHWDPGRTVRNPATRRRPALLPQVPG
jgi:hypothetical protein